MSTKKFFRCGKVQAHDGTAKIVKLGIINNKKIAYLKAILKKIIKLLHIILIVNIN
ncbi:MAG: hypothetical protein N2114_03800 [Candidatus Goldbacteria bacterium]|nr:hypothetical protein [Candidatus Goldiibacteriota bacterium]